MERGGSTGNFIWDRAIEAGEEEVFLAHTFPCPGCAGAGTVRERRRLRRVTRRCDVCGGERRLTRGWPNPDDMVENMLWQTGLPGRVHRAREARRRAEGWLLSTHCAGPSS
jgi:hypothetical protein